MPRKRKQIQEKFPYKATAIISQEDIYTIMNYVQLARKECSFIAVEQDSQIIEHLLEDCGIKFNREKVKKGVRYTLEVPPVVEMSEEAL